MGNMFFLRLQSLPAVADSLSRMREIYEQQKHRNKVTVVLCSVAEFWLFLTKVTIAPICNTFEQKVFNFDKFACKWFDHLQQNKTLFNTSIIQASVTNTIQVICSRHFLSFYPRFSIRFSDISCQSLMKNQMLHRTLKGFGNIVAATNQCEAPIVRVPKKLVVSVYTYVQECLSISEYAWFTNIANAFPFLPSVINVPYRNIINFSWLYDTKKGQVSVIGYVPIHPDDLVNLWHQPGRVYWRRCYAGR